jgi:crotonobetainyl-CoA:carnitine CoA-transferase CaiB-like acyl-CoA transferase
LRAMATPSTWADMPSSPARPAPRLGEHSAEVLKEAGYSDAEIERMLTNRVTAVPGKA